MLGGERGDLMMQAIEERVGLDEQRISALIGQNRECVVDVAFYTRIEDQYLLSHDAGSGSHIFCIGFSNRILRVDQKGDPCR